MPAADIVAGLRKFTKRKTMTEQQYEKRPNSGVIFNPAANEAFAGSGRINLDGAQYDDDLVMVKRQKQDGSIERLVFRKVGILYENDKKGNDSAPDLSGPVWIDGVRRRLAAWFKTSAKTGATFLSLSIDGKEEAQQRMAERQNAAPAATQAPAMHGIEDDEIPF